MKEESDDLLKSLLSNLPEQERTELERTWSLTGAAADPPHDSNELAAAYAVVQGRLGIRRGLKAILGRAALAAAAIVAGIVIGWAIFDSGSSSSEVSSDGRDRYLILIRNDAAPSEARPPHVVVEEFRRWAVELAEAGRLVDGAELADGGLEMLPLGGEVQVDELDPRKDRAAGYFIIRAEDQSDAEAVARACPQLRHGGSIEIRKIKESR